ncbi:MAG TPA: acetyl-coenzyme A synthetase N-terminal domain-containing protein, partial [Caulobacteraceae bacterium]
MSEGQVFAVPAKWAARALINSERYEADLRQVEADPQAYWTELGRRLTWTKPFTIAKDVSFAREDFHIRWYADGELNVSANCLDRHLATRGDETAIIWEGD